MSFSFGTPLILWLVQRLIILAEISPWKNSTFLVLVQLSLQISVRRRLEALSRDIPRPAAVGPDKIYIYINAFL